MPDPAKRGLMLGGTIEIAPLHLRVSAAPFAAVWLDAANVADGWSISTALSCPHHVWSAPDSDRRADVPVRQLRARLGRGEEPQIYIMPEVPSSARQFVSFYRLK
jgi:hypothetical protein